MKVTALVPVKALASAKGRLAPALSPAARRALVAEMTAKVVAALAAAPSVDDVFLVSPDAWPELGVDVIPDRAGDLNGALEAAIAALAPGPEDLVLILAADVPRVEPADVEAMLSAAGAGALAIGRDLAGQGTNALAFRAGARPALRFGLGSLAAHKAEAARLGLPALVVERPGLAFDVDDPQTLSEFRSTPPPN